MISLFMATFNITPMPIISIQNPYIFVQNFPVEPPTYVQIPPPFPIAYYIPMPSFATPIFQNFVYSSPQPVQPVTEFVKMPFFGKNGCKKGKFSRKRNRRVMNNTTVMIRNIPNQFSRYMLVDFLDQLCNDQNVRLKFHRHNGAFAFDFVYLPMDFVRGYNLGYAFVNFTSPEAAIKIWDLLGGYDWGVFEDHDGNMCKSNKICEIGWANLQGKVKLVNHFKNSRFCCNNIEYLPVLFTPPRDGSTSLNPPTTVGNLLY